MNKFEDIRLKKEKFVQDYLNDFDVWFEKNKDKKFDLSLKQIEDFIVSGSSVKIEAE